MGVLLLEHLRGHVVRSADDLGEFISRGESGGCPEINDLDLGQFLTSLLGHVQQDVLRFEVSMDNVLFLPVDKGGEDLFEVGGCTTLA